uniref:Uncharacterized protein n=1 Tax=Arundo donax TaxID=35708 RepID=A0A0A9EA03_ARUDO
MNMQVRDCYSNPPPCRATGYRGCKGAQLGAHTKWCVGYSCSAPL